MIVIIDYGMGNLGSVLNMVRKIGADAIISSKISDIEKADKLILPGIGSFDNGMKNLDKLGFIPILNKKVLEDKTPILGICLGIQLFTKKSEEGKLPGLGWIDAETIKFKFEKKNNNLKIPHMGWNTVDVKKKLSIFKDTYEDERFYFVHSYHLVCNNKKDILSTTHHGYDFVSSIKKDNIIGTQFHPEKSHKYGLKILQNFIEEE